MNIIVAVDKNWAIGKDNKLLVAIPADMKMFRQETTGKVIVLGRKTLETFPGGLPLKNRTNIILTTNKDFKVKDATVVHSIEELLEEIKKYPSDQVYCVGGDSVYKQLLPYCDTEDSEFFLKCIGNANERGWGTAGDNGADCLFTAVQQEMEGDVVWDSISQLDFYITDGSTLTGAVTDDETNAGDGGEGYCNVYVGEDCTWTVTGDSVLTGLSNSGTIVDEDGNTVTVKGSDGTVYVEGTGSYTVTVESYSDSADLSGSSEVTQWSDYQVEKPEALA